MIDTNTIPQVAANVAIVKSQLTPYLPALAVAAGWAGREIANFNRWLFNVASFVIAHGGLWQLLRKLWNNPNPQ
jgi:hypothetical protein